PRRLVVNRPSEAMAARAGAVSVVRPKRIRLAARGPQDRSARAEDARRAATVAAQPCGEPAERRDGRPLQCCVSSAPEPGFASKREVRRTGALEPKTLGAQPSPHRGDGAPERIRTS